MAYALNDLGNALTTQIYHSVMGGDPSVPPPSDTFFTWCMPGIPFSEKDIDFAADGIYSAPTAEEVRSRLNHAANLAILLDFIPDVDIPYDNVRQEGMYKPDAEKRLGAMYRQILRSSKVASDALTRKEKRKLDRFRQLLFETKTVKDLVSGEKRQVTQEGPMLRAYNEKMAAYIAAALAYNAKSVAAASATGADGRAAVADWAQNAQLYYLNVKQAADAWETAGYRNEVNEINAYINQVTDRSMVTWKQSLEEAYDRALLTAPNAPVAFPYTTLIPGNFASNGGWTTISTSHESIDWAKHNESTSWHAGGGVSFGLFSIGGQAGGTNTRLEETSEVNSFNLSFDLAQLVISRPGISPEWFSSRGWILPEGTGWPFDDMPSDGERPPEGEFIGYATQALFARNVSIRSADFVSAHEDLSSKLDVGGSIGFGPFNLGGGYSRSDNDETFASTTDSDELKVNGMQIIGFINHLIGKAPNPLPNLKAADFT
jgi:hypothetical protein